MAEDCETPTHQRNPHQAGCKLGREPTHTVHTGRKVADLVHYDYVENQMNPTVFKEICGAMFCLLAILIYFCGEVSKKGSK